MSEKERQSGEQERFLGASNSSESAEPVLPTVNPATEKPAAPSNDFHPAVYIATWISLSSSIIIFNKWILDTAGFRFPIVLTTWHLAFATLMTQILARFTTVLDSRKKVPMTGKIYLRAIVPIGLMFSLSLICGNLTYLYLSVSFIQMLKVCANSMVFYICGTLTNLGHHTCRSPDRILGLRCCTCQLEDSWKCLSHRYRSGDCILWRAAVRAHWIPLSIGRNCL